ncbi:hypothetical protein [Mycobacterium tuberculosis]|uniref:hypothetical protein n=1 Tax=Mycobacterium tuberculosis TaxID=1773 RepID=UPI000A93F5B2
MLTVTVAGNGDRLAGATCAMWRRSLAPVSFIGAADRVGAPLGHDGGNPSGSIG